MTSHSTRHRRVATPGSEVPPIHGSLAQRFERQAADRLFDVHCSLEQLCLAMGMAAVAQMLEEDAEALAGPRHKSSPGKPCHRWGTTTGTACYHGGKVAIERPRVRDKRTRMEAELPTWTWLSRSDDILRWMGTSLLGVSMRNALRAFRLPGSGVPEGPGAGLTKSSVSRRFKALTQAAFEKWMASDLSGLDLVAIQMDGLHLTRDMVMVGAVGIDAGGNKHVLGVAEGATENAATVQALLDNLIDRGLATDRAYLFILDGAKALSRAVRNTFGDAAEIQRCQVHKGRNVIERLPKENHAAAKIALRQAWTLSDPAKAQRLLENLAKKYDDICPGAARSVREGMPEMLTLTRLGLPDDLRKSLASTNIMESVNAVIARASRNVTRWRNASMGLRWTAAGMLMAQQGFRRVNGHMHLPKLAAALDRVYEERTGRRSGRVAAGPESDARVVA